MENEQVKKILEWIKKYFPETFPLVKKRCDVLDELDDFDEIIYYLNQKFSYLLKIVGKKLNNEYHCLYLQLKEILGDSDFCKTKEKLDNIHNIEEKINFLKNKLDR